MFSQQQRIVGDIVFCAVHVVSEESKQFFLELLVIIVFSAAKSL
jgi:hypothetical protein